MTEERNLDDPNLEGQEPSSGQTPICGDLAPKGSAEESRTEGGPAHNGSNISQVESPWPKTITRSPIVLRR